jgi:hypothetical protein
MPQAEAITVRQHNVPVRENMSRGSSKKLGPCNKTQGWIQPRDSLEVFTLRGGEVVNRAGYPITLTGCRLPVNEIVNRLWQLPRAAAGVSPGAGTASAG